MDIKDGAKSLDWCPYQSNIIVAGGINSEGSVMLWDTNLTD